MQIRSLPKLKIGQPTFGLRTIPGVSSALPKFLIHQEMRREKTAGAENEEEDRVFVMHTKHPRFVMEYVGGIEGKIRLIHAGADETTLVALCAEARVFFLSA